MSSNIFDTIQICESSDRTHLPRSSSACLDEFEQQSGVLLPASYREFCERFGTGELAGFYTIAAPVGVAHYHDLTRHNQGWHGEPSEMLLEGWCPPEISQQLLFFANSGGGDGFAWKVDEPTDTDSNEYAVYALFNDNRFERVAATFAELVDKMISGYASLYPGSIRDPEYDRPNPTFGRS